MEAADPQRSAFFAQGLGYRDETSEPHAADVYQLSQVDDQASTSFGNPGVAFLFELRCALGVHAAGHKQYQLIRYLLLLDSHKGNILALNHCNSMVRSVPTVPGLCKAVQKD